MDGWKLRVGGGRAIERILVIFSFDDLSEMTLQLRNHLTQKYDALPDAPDKL